MYKKILAMFLIGVMAIGLIGCNKGPKEETGDGSVVENPNQLGNSELVNSNDVYVDSKNNQSNHNSFGNNETANTNGSYVDSKENQPIQNTGEPSQTQVNGLPPTVYYSIDDVPENTYAIERIDSNGNAVYYVPYSAWGGRGVYDYYGDLEYTESVIFGERQEGAYGVNPTRFCWVKNGLDETCIPTMYENDKFIYKSSDYIVEGFALERFSDEGYTIGLAGLQKSNSGNYIYELNRSFAQPDSDTVNINNLGASEIYLVSVGKSRVDDSNVSKTGYITGLTKNENYYCDVRTGTTKKEAAFKANIHIFVSLEQYMMSKFYFSHPSYIEIPFEEKMPTGYYSINGSGLFRFVANEDIQKESEGKLEAKDYNVPFITINEWGEVLATTDGYAFDENGYITHKQIFE